MVGGAGELIDKVLPLLLDAEKAKAKGRLALAASRSCLVALLTRFGCL